MLEADLAGRLTGANGVNEQANRWLLEKSTYNHDMHPCTLLTAICTRLLTFSHVTIDVLNKYLPNTLHTHCCPTFRQDP